MKPFALSRLFKRSILFESKSRFLIQTTHLGHYLQLLKAKYGCMGKAKGEKQLFKVGASALAHLEVISMSLPHQVLFQLE